MTQKAIYFLLPNCSNLLTQFLDQFDWKSSALLPIKYDLFESKDGYIIIALQNHIQFISNQEDVIEWLSTLFKEYPKLILCTIGNESEQNNWLFDGMKEICPFIIVTQQSHSAVTNDIKIPNSQIFSEKHPHLRIQSDWIIDDQLQSINCKCLGNYQAMIIEE